MGENDRPIPVKCWIAFLTSLGCVEKSVNASHHKWSCPGCLRSIIFRGAKKEIPRFHIRTNLKTLGVSNSDFNKWAAENC